MYYTDQCFAPTVSNHDIYEDMVKRITLSSLQGINGTVFVYGQTGSGKTYTMLGKDRLMSRENEEPGVLVHSLHDLFSEIQKDKQKTYFVRCSYVEIYNEQVFDLLKN